jgi:hypothetical protein
MPLVVDDMTILLVNLLIQNAISAIFNQVSAMTPEEVAAQIPIEEQRRADMAAERASHGQGGGA